jgi:hypothetical protein
MKAPWLAMENFRKGKESSYFSQLSIFQFELDAVKNS